MTTVPAMAKLLSLWSPWPWFITHSTKRRENRGWPTNFRGPVYIHTAMKSEDNVERLMREVVSRAPLPHGKKLPSAGAVFATRGHIVGRAQIVGCEKNTPIVCLGDPWAVLGNYGFLLDKVEAFDQPVPWKGAQGLVEVDDFGVRLVQWMACQPDGVLDPRRDLAPALVVLASEYVAKTGQPDIKPLVGALVAAGQVVSDGLVYRTRPSTLLGVGSRQTGLGW